MRTTTVILVTSNRVQFRDELRNHLLSSLKSISINAKILISSYKITFFAFTKIVLEQRYFEMIASYVSIFSSLLWGAGTGTLLLIGSSRERGQFPYTSVKPQRKILEGNFLQNWTICTYVLLAMILCYLIDCNLGKEEMSVYFSQKI